MGKVSPVRWSAATLAGAALTVAVAGCGSTSPPDGSDPTSRATVTTGSSTTAPPTAGSPSATPTPLVRVTTTASPMASGTPPDPRGTPDLGEAAAFAEQIREAVRVQVDRLEPGTPHSVTCMPVPLLHLPGGSTRCDVTAAGAGPEPWTVVTVTDSPATGGLVIEISYGIRSDLPPFPPVSPSS